VADVVDGDAARGRIDFVHYPVVTHPDAIHPLGRDELNRTERKGVADKDSTRCITRETMALGRPCRSFSTDGLREML
jgi:hypothetical protein